MAKQGGFGICNQPARTKVHYEDFIQARIDECTIEGKTFTWKGHELPNNSQIDSDYHAMPDEEVDRPDLEHAELLQTRNSMKNINASVDQ